MKERFILYGMFENKFMYLFETDCYETALDVLNVYLMLEYVTDLTLYVLNDSLNEMISF